MTTSPERIATDDEILDAIRKWKADKGYAPTFRDVAAMLGMHSPATAYRHLLRLRRKGYVTWINGTPRTLKVVKRNVKAQPE